jgi:transcriptional regulator with XRE-family HTH domain
MSKKLFYMVMACLDIYDDVLYIIIDVLTPAQLRAARALLGIDQRTLADLAGVSLPTIQRMEASEGFVRGVIDTLTKVVGALEEAGIELIGDNAMSMSGGRGVRLRETASPPARPAAGGRASEVKAKPKRKRIPA